jgi:ABC-type transport system involved in cytochrome c biogenesis permease subunit
VIASNGHGRAGPSGWDWRFQAACRGLPSTLFFGPSAERPRQRRQREAATKAVCARCQVRDLCAAYAFAYQERYGIWGGLTERERLKAWADHGAPGHRQCHRAGAVPSWWPWRRLPGRCLRRRVARRSEADGARACAWLNLAHGGEVVAGRAAQYRVHLTLAVGVDGAERWACGVCQVAVAPVAHGHQHRVQVEALVGQAVFLAKARMEPRTQARPPLVAGGAHTAEPTEVHQQLARHLATPAQAEPRAARVRAGPARPVEAHLPAAPTLDELAYRPAVLAFPVWTFGVIAGGIWAQVAWGRYWGWDPKETWSLIVWVTYAAYLHARATAGWRGRRAAWISAVGLAAIAFNVYAVNLWLAGLHAYAT